MGDLQPISLCNVVYKVVAKILANRLKVLLPKLVSSNQSAFIEGRSIIDKIVMAFELNQFMKGKRKGKDGFSALKLDMSKAYDRLEWAFLKFMLGQFGFTSRWVELIMIFCGV